MQKQWEGDIEFLFLRGRIGTKLKNKRISLQPAFLFLRGRIGTAVLKTGPAV